MHLWRLASIDRWRHAQVEQNTCNAYTCACVLVHARHARIHTYSLCVCPRDSRLDVRECTSARTSTRSHAPTRTHTHTHTNLASRSPSHPGSQAKVCKPLCLGRSPYDQVTWLLTRRIYLAILLCLFLCQSVETHVCRLFGWRVRRHAHECKLFKCMSVRACVRACVPTCLPAWLLGCPAYEAYVGRKEKVDGQARKRERAKERQVTVVNYCTLTEGAALRL